MALTRQKNSIANPIVPHRIIAGVFAMSAFSIALLSGLLVDNPASAILSRALVALLLCYVLGLVVGAICEYVVREHLERYKEAHPVPAEGLAPASAAPTQVDAGDGPKKK